MHSYPIPSFSKKHFVTDFKVTQVKSRKQNLSEETPEESVVATGSNFDILLPLIRLGNSPRVFFFDFLGTLSILRGFQSNAIYERCD